MPIIIKALCVQGNNTGSVEDLRAAAHAIEAARVEPVVDRVFELAAVALAYAHMLAGGKHLGKLAIRVAATA